MTNEQTGEFSFRFGRRDSLWHLRSCADGSEHQAAQLVLKGGCYSTVVRDSHGVRHEARCRGTLAAGNDMFLLQANEPSFIEWDPVGATHIRVRFNTDLLSPDKEVRDISLPWRVLTYDGTRYVEHGALIRGARQCEGFIIHGECYTTTEVLEKVGQKWHIGCFGVLRLVNGYATIVSTEPSSEEATVSRKLSLVANE